MTFNGFQAEGYELKPGSDSEATLAAARHEAVFGRSQKPEISLAYLDSRVYALFDNVPTLNYGCFSRGRRHDWSNTIGVNLPSLKKTTTALLFIAEWWAWHKTKPRRNARFLSSPARERVGA